MKVLNYGLKKEFLDRYDVDAVLKDNHLTAEQIVEDVLSINSVAGFFAALTYIDGHNKRK